MVTGASTPAAPVRETTVYRSTTLTITTSSICCCSRARSVENIRLLRSSIFMQILKRIQSFKWLYNHNTPHCSKTSSHVNSFQYIFKRTFQTISKNFLIKLFHLTSWTEPFMKFGNDLITILKVSSNKPSLT